MKRVGFILKVKQDKIEEYKRHHEQVWPEMLEALRAAGWHNYSLFMAEDGLLFGYFETPLNLATANAHTAAARDDGGFAREIRHHKGVK